MKTNENLFCPELMADYIDAHLHISLAAKVEKLAEESAELAAAASKMARIIRGEYPSKMSYKDARDAVMEEIVDVIAAIDSLNMTPDLPSHCENVMSMDQMFMQEHAHNQMLKFVRRMKNRVDSR